MDYLRRRYGDDDSVRKICVLRNYRMIVLTSEFPNLSVGPFIAEFYDVQEPFALPLCDAAR